MNLTQHTPESWVKIRQHLSGKKSKWHRFDQLQAGARSWCHTVTISAADRLLLGKPLSGSQCRFCSQGQPLAEMRGAGSLRGGGAA